MRSSKDLRDAQQRGIDELYDYDLRQVVLGMGGGKTALTLYAFYELQRDGHRRKMIVIAPPRVAAQVWTREHLKWEELQGLDVVHLNQSAAKRAKVLAEDHDVYVISIGLLPWLVEQLKKYKKDNPRFDVLAVDEISKFKDPISKRGKKLLGIIRRFKSVWGLTGTPRPNGYVDQYMPLRIVSRDTVWDEPNFTEWRREHFKSDYYGYKWEIHTFAVPIIQRKIDRYTVAFPPSEMPDLPPLNTGEDYLIQVDLTGEQQRAYAEMEEKLLVKLREQLRDDEELDPDYIVAALSQAVKSSKLEQIAQGFIYDEREGERKVVAEYKQEKLGALEELRDAAGGEPLLVTYHFQHDLENLRKVFGDKLPYLGSGVTEKRSMKYINAWNAGDLPVMALHPASAGHGIELQFGGRLLAWYCLTWSAENYDQTIKRIHRPGQELPVMNYIIETKDTVDEIKYCRVERKMDEQEAFKSLLRKI